MPGIKITDADRKNIEIERFICCCCNLLLKLPMQTICGHLMCQSCLEELLKYDAFCVYKMRERQSLHYVLPRLCSDNLNVIMIV